MCSFLVWDMLLLDRCRLRGGFEVDHGSDVLPVAASARMASMRAFTTSPASGSSSPRFLKLKSKSFDCEIELRKKVASVNFNRDFVITSTSPKIVTLSLIYGGIAYVIAFIILGIFDKRKSIKEYLESEDED